MAKLSNINNLFSVDSTGAIEFSTQVGATGYVLESRGAGNAPVWTDRDTGKVTGTGVANKVAYWTSATNIDDGPITFATNNSTFAGTITSGTLSVGTSGTSRFTDTSAFPLQLNRGLAVDVVGAAGTIFGLGAYSTGTTYIDAVRIVGVLEANGTDGDMQLQVLNSGTHAIALTLNNNTNASFTGTVTAPRIGIPGANSSFALYNDSNSYFNGAVTVDSTFTQTSGAASSFSGLVSGITPTAAANFTTKAYVDSFDPPTGTTQFFNQSNSYNNFTPGITGYGDISMDTSVSYYDTGKNVSTACRGIVWTGKHYIVTHYASPTANFYDNNFVAITNPETASIALPQASGTSGFAHGAAWDGRYLYTLNYNPVKITAYDLDNGTSTATIVMEQATSNTTTTYAIEYAEGHLYTCADGKVSKYKVEGKTITHVFTSTDILGSIEAQAITYDGSYLWFTQNGLSAYKVSLDCVLVATITTGLPPNNVAWAWNGQNIASVNHSTGDVYVINTAAKRFDTEKFLVMGGNVGIGTTSPQVPLQIGTHLTTAPTDTGLCVSNRKSIRINDADGSYNYGVYMKQNYSGSSYLILGTRHGAVDTDALFVKSGNVGIGINGPSEKLHVNGSTYMIGGVATLASSGVGLRVSNPGGASVATQVSTVTGAIKIILPSEFSNTMMRMTVKVYEYATNESFVANIAGYNHTSQNWYNISADITSNANKDRNFTVRYGYDGTNCVIYIGELNSTWSYPQVFVTDFQAGFSAYTVDRWVDGWTIGYEASAFQGTIFSVSNCQVTNWARNGQNVYYASGSGNVGINETSPDAKLHVMGTTGLPATSGTTFTGTMRLGVSGYGTVMDFGAVGPATGTQWIQVTDASNQAIQYPLLLQPNGGNVGIGLTLPTSKLTVGNGDIELSDSGFSNVPQLKSTGFSGGGRYVTGAIKFDEMNAFNGEIQFWTTPTSSGYANANANHAQRMVIDKDGNVGIGTASPTGYRLVVENTSEDLLKLHNSTDGLDALISFTNPGGTLARIQGIDNGGLAFDVGNNAGGVISNAMFIQNNGNVVIGGTAVDQAGSFTAKSNGFIRGVLASGSNESSLINAISGVSNGFQLMNNASNEQEYRFHSSHTGGPNISFKIEPSGTITAAGDVVAYSDKRLKSNIKTLDGSKVYDMRGVSFIKNNKKGSGVIAQEMQKIAPELVNDGSEYLGVAYGNLSGYLIEAIKELKAEIEELKKHNCNCNK